jgi:hypothetical protein
MERAGEKLLSSIELDYETVLKCQSIFNWLCGNNRFLKFLTETEVPATYRLIDKKRDNEYKTVNYKNFMECYKYIDKILSFVKDDQILEAYTTQMLAIKNETDAGLLWKQFAELNKPISMSIVVNSTMSKGIIVKEDSIATFNSSIEGLSILPSYNQLLAQNGLMVFAKKATFSVRDIMLLHYS